MPPEVLSLLEPAIADYNRLLTATKAEGKESDRWRWARDASLKGKGDLEQLARLAEGTQPIDHRSDGPTIDWLRYYPGKHPAISAFLQASRLSLRHLVRLLLAMSSGHFQSLLGTGSDLVIASVQHRLAAGTDLRTLHALWLEAGGNDYVRERLAPHWLWPAIDIETPLWPLLCQHFALLDEALGLLPQSGDRLMQEPPALDFLATFPKLPERYRGRLLAIAVDGVFQSRAKARALLRDTAGIGGAIAQRLQDGHQEARARAADWLGARKERAQIAALRAALAEERSDVARAAMITALERLGADVTDCFDPDVLVKEAQTGLARARPKGLDWLPLDRLPALKWKDGSAVDPVLPRWWVVLAAKLKQPGGYALLNLWLDRLAPDDAHRLGWLVLTGWIDADTRKPSDEEANTYAAQQVEATLKAHSYHRIDRDELFARFKRDKAVGYQGSALAAKGVLALATRMDAADAAQRVRSFQKDHGQRIAQVKALFDLLAAIGTGPALQLVLSAANRSKQRSVQAHAAALVDAIAERNGWTTIELADRTIPTAGFDADGGQALDCGEGRRYRLQLDARDAVVIRNAEGRDVKTLPAPRGDNEREVVDAAKKQLASVRKEVKQVLAAQTERLQEAMCLQRRWARDDWKGFIAAHSIVGRLAARLVWQSFDAEGRPAVLFRPLGDGSYTDAADGDVSLAGFAEIGLAHSSLLDTDALAAWRQHLIDYAVASPFDQLGRDLPSLADGQEASHAIADREGWMIDGYKLRSATTRLGYRRSLPQDSMWFVAYEKAYRDAGLIVEIEFTGNITPEDNRPTALQSLVFRTLRDGKGTGSPLTLADVPRVLLVECWADLHDIAAAGTGFDADWQKKVSQ